MKHEIIYTEDYALIVSELTSPGKEGQVFLSKENIIHTVVGWNYGDRLIIAHRSLQDAPILEGVPLLPEFSQEDVVVDLALTYSSSEGNINPEGYSDKQVGLLHGFIDGYNKAKETYRYTEEDLIECILFGMKKGLSVGKIPETDNDWVNNYVKSLQQPKRPKFFEYVTIYRVKSGTIQEHKDGLAGFEYYEPKTIVNSKGQEELVGSYIF